MINFQTGIISPVEAVCLDERLVNLPTDFQPVLRKGDTAVGHAVETHLGIAENNFADSDTPDYEVKAHREDSSSRITLFTRAPEPLPRAEGEPRPPATTRILCERYGYAWDENGDKVYGTSLRRFCTSFAANRYTEYNGTRFTVAVEDGEVRLIDQDGTAHARWTREKIERVLTTKLKAVALITVQTKDVDGVEHMRFAQCQKFDRVKVDAFFDLILSGDIQIEFRARLTDGKMRDRGTAFRIEKELLASLFEAAA